MQVNGQWYVFYHRQTHATETSRQGCAERITILPDGSIPQVEITSCGLNDGPLNGDGEYSAAHACHLTGKDEFGIIIYGQDRKQHQPYIYQEDDALHYIANIKNGTVFGWKYFEFSELHRATIFVRGDAKGQLELFVEEPKSGSAMLCSTTVDLNNKEAWIEAMFDLPSALRGTHPIYIRYTGEGSLAVKSIKFY